PRVRVRDDPARRGRLLYARRPGEEDARPRVPSTKKRHGHLRQGHGPRPRGGRRARLRHPALRRGAWPLREGLVPRPRRRRRLRHPARLRGGDGPLAGDL
ncbi:MAG: D-beta-hydroxybutyrate dehydrogenase, partial [uncultured Rubrobacteraceae bacterium]